MTREQARKKANALWGTPGIGPDDRYGIVTVRQKKIVDRFEVGYCTRGGPSRPGGMWVSHDWTVMGKGRTWEEAFARAEGKETP